MIDLYWFLYRKKTINLNRSTKILWFPFQLIVCAFCRLLLSLLRLFVEVYQSVFLKYVLQYFYLFIFAIFLSLFPNSIVCDTQFRNIGSLEQHGFARNRVWSVDPDPPAFPSNTSHRAFVDLILRHSEEDVKIWPHRCITQYEFWFI